MAKSASKPFVLTVFLLSNFIHLVLSQGTQFVTGPCTSDADCASGCCGFNSGKCAGPIVAQERDGGCGFGESAPNDNAANILVGQEAGVLPTATSGTSLPATAAVSTVDVSAVSTSTPALASTSDEPIPITATATSGTTGAAAVSTTSDEPTPIPTPAISGTAGAGAGAGAVAVGTQFITGPCTSDADCASGCCGFNSGTCAGPVVAQERDGGCGFGDAQPNDNAAQAIQGKRRRRTVKFNA
ncbi:hypothetical protein FQN55_004255 [Onygenales sp. PD_40]|nr:hypothetical protein FQN55_004255 [Onygenales sp. PD_40]KAK2784158.1 hypothetical protein FQN53_008767 [Emmonsiellopsis sp. PD_33]